MPDVTLNERDTKLVQWLNEAYAKEAELEADLTAHIALTEKQSYKKRLRKHLTETRDHKRRVASRIKRLGGGTVVAPNVPEFPARLARSPARPWRRSRGRSVAHARRSPTRPRRSFAMRRRSFARNTSRSRSTPGSSRSPRRWDRETVQLAKAIRRDEERMAKFLDAELGRLVKDVVRKQVPRDQRPTRSSRSGSRRRPHPRRDALLAPAPRGLPPRQPSAHRSRD